MRTRDLQAATPSLHNALPASSGTARASLLAAKRPAELALWGRLPNAGGHTGPVSKAGVCVNRPKEVCFSETTVSGIGEVWKDGSLLQGGTGRRQPPHPMLGGCAGPGKAELKPHWSGHF